ncbi:DUF1223 domain-containing protein [Flavitalea sp. BT771]|uniref:DUF1223 domain-containing protein n=1 Tax=Flavitalea sp. BT771 TaxID=3063329 RepID=UPI0026E47DC6|nr:DUF1223 domain-containing protein [Flavitalea sp. BT771]MDO6430736.1 DUF1223 domain-containing protein [Flavitalea sp. BT771]MDV6219124.1 DUF1223 domain-containing protein [Flavitalea sp. BT771]
MPSKILLLLGLLPTLFLSGPGRPADADGFALVELFTSEGCSSCPAADELVASLPKSYPRGVYVLSFHVDYWDRLGWKDPFSKADYTLRQKQYTEVLELRSLYTPQVIINGKTEMVGSDEVRLRQAVDEELAHTTNAAVEANAHSADGKTITVDYTLTGKSQGALQAALIQLEASTAVKNGENAGRQLHHTNIVRDLKTSNKSKGALTLTFPASLTAANCKVLVFLQNKDDLHVSGARLLDIH